MSLVAVLYSDITRIMLVPFVFFCSFCVAYYHQGGPGFFFGELGFITTYVSFCTVALHPRLVPQEGFSVFWWIVSCAPPAYLLTTVAEHSISVCHSPQGKILL
eukprot:TRINITY_DN1453_c0_g1_i2.p1 TRINITY_DN1453_c0_g1~~TRINITY_DN1453_c0_g1_i2.p1  ORF type:complete len:103 (+),score=15.68 TRINITY_DN1453_c0_g1_i2:142-450(+)